MASTNNRDPRLNAQKRPPSRSPDGSTSSAKRHAGPSQLSNTLTLDSPSGNGIAPTASMSPTRVESSTSAVEKFFEATIQAADLRIQLRSAQTESNKADREFQALQDKFDRFPAIKEQKTTARTRASEKVGRIQQRINDQMPEQRHILSSLASLLDQSNVNTAIGQEVHGLKLQLSQFQGVRTSLSSLESRMDALKNGAKGLTQSDSTAALEPRLKTLENQPQTAPAGAHGLQEKLKELETRLRSSNAKATSDVTSRIVKLETALSNAAEATTSLRKQMEITSPAARHAEDSSRLTIIESRIRQMEDDSVSDRDQIIEHVDQEVATLRGVVDSTLQASKTALKKDVSDELNVTKNGLRAEVSDELLAIKSQFAEASKIQNQNAAAINDCLERMQKLEAADDLTSRSALSSLQQTMKDLQEKLQKLEDEKLSSATRSTPAGNSSVWQPVLPDNEDELSDGAQPNGIGAAGGSANMISRLREEVEMLKGVTTQHTRVINNLTTDEIVRQMVDQMSAMYPEARNFQTAANDLRLKVSSAHELLGTLNEHIKRTVGDVSELAQRIPELQATLGEEVRKLQVDIAGLARRTEQHDSALDESQTRLQTMDRLAAANKILLEGAQATKEKLKTVASLQEQLLRLRELYVKSSDKSNESDSGTQHGGIV
ncbi:hypothetical protein Slin15195_G030550 [Septoria linicola]|uniref:Uncharacterized protein n=1 Tax=Septoria linicola TaxID=215465 RepID=A0A9Q9AS44_9PEZI|nr:hypothetical protein Slin14017_G029570 [Septoria linicola]USW49736.1 hypothetical protein Slin15195_G030550 [Septoria linicola]